MKTYMTPDVFMTEFQADAVIAAESCDRVITGTETEKVYNKQTVTCNVGGQIEEVFNTASGCSTAASNWFVTSDNLYFFWYTGGTDGVNATPSPEQIALMEGYVGGSAQGWHYDEIISEDQIHNIYGFSF